MISGEVVGEGRLGVDSTSRPDKFVETVLSPTVYGTNLWRIALISIFSITARLQPTCTGLMGRSKPVHSKSKKTILGLLDLFLPWLPIIIIEGFYYFQNYESEIETWSNKTDVTLA